MITTQRLAIRASEIRGRLAELAGVDELDDETRGELEKLRNEYTDVETRSQAAILSESIDPPIETRHREEGDAEGREMRSLISKCNVGKIFDSALERRATDGPEKELQEFHKLNENQVPLALLETRAVSPAPGQVGQNLEPIIPYVFPDSASRFLGIDMPTVPVGDSVFAVLTSELDVGTPAENATQAETTGAFSANILSPSRLQASFFYSREDRSRFAGMDEALRMNLSDGLSDGLDKQVLQGTNGLLTGTNLGNHNASAETTFEGYIQGFGYGRVDGRFASMTSDLRAVMGSGSYAHAGGTYRNTSVDRNAVDRLMEITSGIKVSAHVPAVVSHKQNAVVRLGMRRDCVVPLWQGISILDDQITKASSGQIVITAIMLHAVKIVRAAGFYKIQTQHA